MLSYPCNSFLKQRLQAASYQAFNSKCKKITDKTVGDILSTATLRISNEVYTDCLICVIFAN